MTSQRISTWLALRCKEPLFWRFLQVANESDAIVAVRKLCDVTSRREFDRDQEAAKRFHEIIRHPFIDFTHDPKADHA
ncbi:hypothetical protein ACFDR9_001606 [Janthinobacterium sp. CG_23.3]|uniref:hypothetical protein n=1 Tax=Janthinobacterium sp. CG_23.3 TaxID=3349634 RepID=UPI0038D469A3